MKFKSKFQKIMFLTAAVSFLGTVCFFSVWFFSRNNILFAAVVTSFTVFYHFAVRLFIGEWLLKRLIANTPDYNHPWFRHRRFEQGLYRILRVKDWKGQIPTYAPEEFSIRTNSWEQIAAATCRSELVHEMNILASFVPLLFALFFGEFPVFLITSLLAAAVDLSFVILQRFNRPRLIRMIKKSKR